MKRYTIDFGEKFDKLLNDLSDEKEVPKSEIIRRAVALYAFMQKEIAGGNNISITNKDGQVIKELALL